MNQKGMAISTILYMIIIIFGLVIVTYMGVLVKSNSVNRASIDKVKTSLGVGNLSANDKLVRKQYRYMQADGTYSDWTDYTSVSEIDKTINFTCSSSACITNNGSMGNNYSLTSNGIDLKIENGESYLDFNGSSDRGNSAFNVNGFTVNSLYFDGIINRSNDIITAFNNTIAFLITSNNIAFSSPDWNKVSAINDTVTFGNRMRVLLTWSNNGVYNIYLNGIKKAIRITDGATSHAYPMEILKIALGYGGEAGGVANAYYFDGKIYDLRLSSKRLTDTEAIALTNSTIEPNSILDKNTAEVIYGDFVQYRTIFSQPPKDDTKISNTFSARYVRDYTGGFNNGTVSDVWNHWVEVEANAYFKKGDYFHGVIVGGTYTGTYTPNMYDGVSNPGEMYFTSGEFIHPNGLSFNISQNVNLATTFEYSSAANSALIMFTGSDISRFSMADSNYGKSFLFVKYINGVWYYDDNGGFTKAFVPNENDAIVGFAERGAIDTEINGIARSSLFKYPFSYNVALGCSITGTDPESSARPYSRIVDGDITASNYSEPNSTIGGNKYIQIDLGADYPITNVNTLHYYGDGRTYYQTTTELYSSDRSSKYVLNNYLQNGLYKEMPSGMTFSVK